MQVQNEGNRYFLQLIPIHLNRTPRKHQKIKNQAHEIKFALFLQSQKISQSKSWIQLQYINNVYKCKSISLDFSIVNFNSDFYSNFTLKIMRKEPPKLSFQSDQQICKVEQTISELGFFQLDPGVYISTFNQDRKALFQENIQVSPEYSLDYEIFIEKTRFRLEKFIRQARGINNESNVLASAFKKRIGKKKVRYVELSNSRQHSVKEQDFKKNQKALISSLKRSGNKYVPQKTVQPHSRDETPIKLQKNSYFSNLICQSHSPFAKKVIKISLNDISEGNDSLVDVGQFQRGDMFDRSMISPHWSFDYSFLTNRRNYENFLERASLICFWGIALFILYISMTPSRRI